MKNIKELRDELSTLYKSVKANKTKLETAKILVGTANAMLNAVQIELNQNKFIGNKKPIEFLKGDK